MATTVKESSVDKAVYAAQAAKVAASDKIKNNDIYTKIFGDYEFHRYLIYPILLIWTVCLAGIAVAVGAMDSVIQSALLAFPTMAMLVWLLAVQPMKTILRIATVATILDLAIIIYNIM